MLELKPVDVKCTRWADSGNNLFAKAKKLSRIGSVCSAGPRAWLQLSNVIGECRAGDGEGDGSLTSRAL